MSTRHSPATSRGSNAIWLWLLATGYLPLVAGFWLPASGSWLLASGFWFPALGFWNLNHQGGLYFSGVYREVTLELSSSDLTSVSKTIFAKQLTKVWWYSFHRIRSPTNKNKLPDASSQQPER
jgi:hypothetical protein